MPLHLNTSRSRWLVAGAVGAAAAAMYFGDKTPYPYPQHLLLDLPLPFLTKLGPAGQLDIVDIQKEMLGHVMRQARRKELTTISPSLSDARNLPFGDNLFDAVYLVTALGEIPEPELVIAEAARVIKPSGRLVVGEFFDRHWIPFSRLRRMATESGFQIDDWSGPTLAYMARFRPIERDAPLAQSTFVQ